MRLDGYLNVSDFAKLLKINRGTLYRWEKQGKLVPTLGTTEDDGRVNRYYTQEHIDIIKSWDSKESVMLMFMGY